MTDMMIKKRISDLLEDMTAEKDISTTGYIKLDTDNDGNDWGIVFGWVEEDNYSGDRFSSDKYRLYGKCAYISRRSIMTEYDVDWLMPVCENGDVDDVEVSLDEFFYDDEIDWLIEQFRRFQETYILPAWVEDAA